MSASKPVWRVVLQPAVIDGALGYFADIYDLILSSILRSPSLRALIDLEETHGKDLDYQGVI